MSFGLCSSPSRADMLLVLLTTAHSTHCISGGAAPQPPQSQSQMSVMTLALAVCTCVKRGDAPARGPPAARRARGAGARRRVGALRARRVGVRVL